MNTAERMAAVRKKVDAMGVSPIDILIVGATGVGKSSTLNALFGKNVSKVGESVNPETMDTPSFVLKDGLMRFWDSPGLGDGIENDKKHHRKIRKLLEESYIYNKRRYGKIDLVLVILDGSSRDMGTFSKIIDNVMLPCISENRIIVAINKCDLALCSRHWDNEKNCPDDRLLEEISKREKGDGEQKGYIDRMGDVFTNRKRVISYSALKEYNIDKLFDFIINSVPNYKRRYRAKN